MTAPVTEASLVVETLKETAVLVRIRTKAFGKFRTDKTASAEMTEKKKASPGAGRVVVSRLPGCEQYVDTIEKAQERARAELKKLSRQYDEDGWRIMGNDKVELLLESLGQVNRDFKDARDTMIAKAPDIIIEVTANLGEFDVPPPTLDELKDAYHLDLDFQPVPDAANYRNLPSRFDERIREKTVKAAAASYQRGQAEILERLLEPLGSFVERMQAFDERMAMLDEGTLKRRDQTGMFKDSLIEKVKAIGDQVRAFNLARDPRWDDLADRIDALATPVSAEDLRADNGLRKRARENAKAVLDTVKDWGV